METSEFVASKVKKFYTRANLLYRYYSENECTEKMLLLPIDTFVISIQILFAFMQLTEKNHFFADDNCLLATQSQCKNLTNGNIEQCIVIDIFFEYHSIVALVYLFAMHNKIRRRIENMLIWHAPHENMFHFPVHKTISLLFYLFSLLFIVAFDLHFHPRWCNSFHIVVFHTSREKEQKRENIFIIDTQRNEYRKCIFFSTDKCT